ncbi:MAG: methylated-DNA--[protein]-cysteine S-methyltransferase [Clostridiales Family XIII bacterium]|jgi:methylated-DNA-[protein]-cysteine S-methyltransferase|nr:methylated-DNA--[protein]-cysteine S-methyltransferase [Clostridiales Family XIII bacterium]
MYYATTHPSPIGLLTLACDGDNLVGLWTEGQKYHGDTIPEAMTERDEMPVFHAAKQWLDRYFAGEKPACSELPLAPIGGAFRQGVWRILCEIPYGEVITYGDIAKQTAASMHRKSMSAQAVGGAVGRNPISIIIPCHRVVGANGNLTGYAGGLAAKLRLLELEGVDTSKLFMPKTGTAL